MTKKPPEGKHWCPGCGEALDIGVEHEMVTRVVRDNNRYDNTGPGGRVRVEARYANDPSVERATMSLIEHEQRQAEASAHHAPPPGRLAQMVRNGFDAAAAQTRAMIEAGKARLQRDAVRAVEQAQAVISPPTE